MKSDSASILLDLIIKKSVSGLSQHDQLVIDELLASAPHPGKAASELQQFETTIAALDLSNLSASARENLRDELRQSGNFMNLHNDEHNLANSSDRESDHHEMPAHLREMPAHLRETIIAEGMAFVDKAYGSGKRKTFDKSTAMAVDFGSDVRSESSLNSVEDFGNETFGEFRPRGVRVGKRNSLSSVTAMARMAAAQFGKLGGSVSRLPKVREVGTLIAAAAGLLTLALFLRQQPEPVETMEASQFASLEEKAPSLILMDDTSVNRHQRETFLTNPPNDMIRVSCQLESQANSTGEFLWSDSQQKGFVTLTGLEVNDPDQLQYQLWIFDADANQSYPVNGGVFNVVEKDGSVILLRPQIDIRKAVKFMVTQERPSGVVTPSRDKVVAVATIGK